MPPRCSCPGPGSSSPAATFAEAVVAVLAALTLPARHVGFADTGPRVVALGLQGTCGDPGQP